MNFISYNVHTVARTYIVWSDGYLQRNLKPYAPLVLDVSEKTCALAVPSLPVLRRPVPSHPVPSHLLPSRHFRPVPSLLSRPVPSPSLPPHLIPSRPISSHPIPSHSVPPRPTPSHPIPPHPIPSLSHPIPSHPLPSRPAPHLSLCLTQLPTLLSSDPLQKKYSLGRLIQLGRQRLSFFEQRLYPPLQLQTLIGQDVNLPGEGGGSDGVSYDGFMSDRAYESERTERQSLMSDTAASGASVRRIVKRCQVR